MVGRAKATFARIRMPWQRDLGPVKMNYLSFQTETRQRTQATSFCSYNHCETSGYRRLVNIKKGPTVDTTSCKRVPTLMLWRLLIRLPSLWTIWSNFLPWIKTERWNYERAFLISYLYWRYHRWLIKRARFFQTLNASAIGCGCHMRWRRTVHVSTGSLRTNVVNDSPHFFILQTVCTELIYRSTWTRITQIFCLWKSSFPIW